MRAFSMEGPLEVYEENWYLLVIIAEDFSDVKARI